MINFRTGSQLYRLITLLSVAGEYPTQSLHLLGNERMYKRLVSHLTEQTTILNPHTDESITLTKVVGISGKGKNKKVRLYRGALPILEWINAKEYYMKTFREHNFSGDAKHVERNHRVAEALALFMGAGFEFREYKLPVLQNAVIHRLNFVRPSFYTTRHLKQIGKTEMNKTMYTRIVGAVIAGNECYAVYNTRNAVMKWCGMGESKARTELEGVIRMNTEIAETRSAILLGASDKVVLSTIEETERNRKLELRFDGIYNHIHFVPLNEIGMRQLNLFTVPNWKEKLLDLLFEDEQRSYGLGSFEYDAYVDGVYMFSHLDGDLARLMRFKRGIGDPSNDYAVICFEDQVAFLKEYLSGLAQIRVIKRADVESELNLKRRDFFEED